MVQLGAGFMRLFGQKLTTCGASVATYFEFHRPKSITLSFREIVKRANTPFVLAIKKLAESTLQPAEVSEFENKEYLLFGTNEGILTQKEQQS